MLWPHNNTQCHRKGTDVTTATEQVDRHRFGTLRVERIHTVHPPRSVEDEDLQDYLQNTMQVRWKPSPVM